MTKSKVWVATTVVVYSLFFISSVLYAGTDTTVKGTTSNNAQASLEVTNSSNTTLMFVRNDGNVGIGDATPAAMLTVGSGDLFQVDSSGNASGPNITANTNFVPDANDGAGLGTTSLQFSDLFLAEGAVVDFDNGDMTLTQVGNDLTVAGGSLNLAAGTTSDESLNFPASTLLTTAADGAVEMDADVFYGTNDAGNRGYIPTKQFIRVDSGTARTLPNDTATNPVFGSPTNGRITLETGTYVFEFLYNITGMSATSGNAQILFGGAGTFSEWNWYFSGIDNSTLTTLLDDDSAYYLTNASAASAVTAVTGTALRVHGRGTFTCTAGGTFIPQIDLVNAAGATVQPGSYFMCERIGSTSVISVGQWD